MGFPGAGSSTLSFAHILTFMGARGVCTASCMRGNPWDATSFQQSSRKAKGSRGRKKTKQHKDTRSTSLGQSLMVLTGLLGHATGMLLLWGTAGHSGTSGPCFIICAVIWEACLGVRKGLGDMGTPFCLSSSGHCGHIQLCWGHFLVVLSSIPWSLHMRKEPLSWSPLILGGLHSGHICFLS